MALPAVATAAAAPQIDTVGAHATGAYSATVSGSGNAEGLSTTVRAYYALAGERWCVSHGAEGTHAETGVHELGAGDVEISEILVVLSGLEPSSEYCAELVATNADGTAQGGQVSFTTPTPPAIESESVSHFDATLEALINPNGNETTYVFYLEAPLCGANGAGACEATGGKPVYEGRLPAGTSAVRVSVDLASVGQTLSPGTAFRFRVTATSETDGVPATAYGPEIWAWWFGETVVVGVPIEFAPPNGETVVEFAPSNADGTSPGTEETTPTVQPTGAPTVKPPTATTGGAGASTFEVPPEGPAQGARTQQEPTSEITSFVRSAPLAASALDKMVTGARPLTRAQKLADALGACANKMKKRRAICERRARAKYAKARKSRKRAGSRSRSPRRANHRRSS